MLMASAAVRCAVALGLVALLWLAVGWGLSA